MCSSVDNLESVFSADTSSMSLVAIVCFLCVSFMPVHRSPARCVGGLIPLAQVGTVVFANHSIEYSTKTDEAKPETEEEKLKPQDVREIILKLAEIIREKYVLPEKAVEIADAMMDLALQEEITRIESPSKLAERLRTELLTISADKHFSVRFDPDFNVEEDRTPDPGSGRFHNFGVREIKRLDGNIGYLRFSGFHDPQVGLEPFKSAVRLLANTDAIILDIRENGGGSSAMSTFVSSFFLEQEKIELTGFWSRHERTIRQRWNVNDLGGTRLSSQPLYILTSEATFSAAESVAYDLQALKRAVIVGEVTGGGAHKIDYLEIVKGFRIQIPNEKAVNPITGGNWEQVGVQPDVVCSESEALPRAIELASKALLENEENLQIRSELMWGIAEAQSRLKPVALSDNEKRKVVGQYEIEEIVLRNNVLWCKREGYSAWKMEYMGQGEFRLPTVSNYRLKFSLERDEVDELTGIYKSGQIVKRKRTDNE